MKQLAQDVQFALRTFGKSPVFTVVAILSLALGIGANTAIFSLVDQLILRLLPVKDPRAVVLLAGKGHHYGSNNGRNALSYPMYQDFRDRNQVFSEMMCRYSQTMTIGVSSHTEVVNGELVSGNYFHLLGIGAALGRVFTAQDDLHPGAHPYAVLSYAYWQSNFAGDPHVIGQTIRVNNYPLTIVGVSQKGFDGVEPGLPNQIRVPMMMAAQVRPGFTRMFERRQRWVNVFGRLKPGMTLDHAQAGMQPLFHQITSMEVLMPAFRKATPYDKSEFLKMWLAVMPGSQGNTLLRDRYEKPLWVLMAVVGLVLLIACANLASLLTARAASRQKEVAIRLALGSGRGRLIRQLVTESLLLSIAGGAAGIGIAVPILKGLLSYLPPNLSGYTISSTPDTRMLAFTLAISLLTGVLFGLAPALQATKPDVAGTLKDEAASVAGGGGQLSFRKVLVAMQVTLSLVLLIGAGLFLRSLGNLRFLDPGFRTKNLIQFGLNPRAIGYDPERTAALYQRFEDKLRATPGITGVGLSAVNLLANNEWDEWVTIEGYVAGPGEKMDPHFNSVSTGYVDTMGMHILSGRNFNVKDDRKAPRVALVNSKFAKRYFRDRSPLGKHIGEGSDPGTPTDIEIVGIVNDTRYESLRDEIPMQVFLCARQGDAGGTGVYVQTQGDAKNAFGLIRAAAREIDPTLPVTQMKTFERQLDDSLTTDRMIASLSSVFGSLATGLVLIGLYGVMAFMVARRSREIAIRMALGAMAGNVVWLVMREVLILIGCGIALGLPAAYALTKLVQAQLYGIEASDPQSIVVAVVLLAAVTAAAGYIPARRATFSDPLRILRYE
ncbi:MAG TPA: ABC transporter permease [Bryobacteraceae bacterium]|nr:ABC transporter permease [Bryobacteraceae bacterium]